jgi:hypothetical protein
VHTNRSDSAIRHLDFAFFDVLVMQLSFIMMYGITRHEGFIYNDEQYMIQASVFLVVQIALGLFSNAYDRIYTRGIYEELKSMLLNIGMIMLLSGAFILMTHTPVKIKNCCRGGAVFRYDFFVRQANKARHLRRACPSVRWPSSPPAPGVFGAPALKGKRCFRRIRIELRDPAGRGADGKIRRFGRADLLRLRRTDPGKNLPSVDRRRFRAAGG